MTSAMEYHSRYSWPTCFWLTSRIRVDLMIVFGRLSVQIMQIQPAARGSVQDTHQCSLCVAIANVKAFMLFVPKSIADFGPGFQICNLKSEFLKSNYCVGSSSSSISDSAAPAGTIG